MDFLANIKIRTKLLIMMIPLVLGVITLGYFSFFGQVSAVNTLKIVKDSDLARVRYSQQLKIATVQVQQWLTDFTSTENQKELNSRLEVAEAWAKVFHQSLDELVNLNSENSRELMRLKRAFEDYYSIGRKVAVSYTGVDPHDENQLMVRLDNSSSLLTNKVDSYVDMMNSQFKISLSNVTDEIFSSASSTIWIAILSLIISLTSAFLVGNRITYRLRLLEKDAEEIATGNLSTEIREHGDDEIGNASKSLNNIRKYFISIRDVATKLEQNDFSFDFKPSSDVDEVGKHLVSMTENLNRTFAIMLCEVDRLLETSKDLSNVATDLAKGATEQIDDTNQVSYAVEQITTTIAQSSENASEATELARDAANAASQGNKVVAQTIEGMSRIADVVQGSATTIQSLASSSDRIGSIVGVISEIADQTNLLALNAAIEAARAGDQGRGFAVVADEVRKLAERTTSATDEITEMIKSIQRETKSAVDSVQRGIEEVEAGKELADRAGNSLRSIAEYSARVQEMIQQIATASSEEAIASEGVAKGIGRIAAVSQNTASCAERSAAVANEFSVQSDILRYLVRSFKIKSGAVEELSDSDSSLLIPWSDRLTLGIIEIDRQHKKLVDLINNLHVAMVEKKSSSMIIKTLDELVDYTKTHFSFEEKMMRDAGYPGSDHHKELHDKLTKKVISFQEQVKSGHTVISNEIMIFLRDWLTEHIQQNDRQYVSYMNKVEV